ncbi:hypothetical protein C2W64_01263 [Brevibacillus laterosporus]|nr:hypothetical protein C2W64_01263 [Brevibacillus laterosporus]
MSSKYINFSLVGTPGLILTVRFIFFGDGDRLFTSYAKFPRE